MKVGVSLAALAAIATLAIVSKHGGATELNESHALRLAAGSVSSAEKTEIAAGGTRFLDDLRSSIDAARAARQHMGGTSMRVAEGQDQLEQMPDDERAADTEEAAQALKNYMAQEASLQGGAAPQQQQNEEQPRMGARKHFKWDNMADRGARVTSVLRQQRRTRPAPAVRDADHRMESMLARKGEKSPPPMSEAFTIGIDNRGRLDKQGVRAFLESNGNPQAAQKALAKERDHVGDEEVTWGDDNVSLTAADAHPKSSGIRDLFKGMTGDSGW